MKNAHSGALPNCILEEFSIEKPINKEVNIPSSILITPSTAAEEAAKTGNQPVLQSLA